MPAPAQLVRPSTRHARSYVAALREGFRRGAQEVMSERRIRQIETDFAAHVHLMEGFHRRYMVSNKVLRLWVAMARKLDIAMIVPQHGAPIMGKEAINDFFEWIENLMCGIDLFDDRAYQIPTAYIDPVTRQMRPALRAVNA